MLNIKLGSHNYYYEPTPTEKRRRSSVLAILSAPKQNYVVGFVEGIEGITLRMQGGGGF